MHGRPAADAPSVRQLERDTAAMTGDNPYSGVVGQHIVNYQAGAAEQRILHMQTADPLRTPTYTMFPVPDYYFATSGPERLDQQRVRLEPRLLLAEHRRHVGRASSGRVSPPAV